MTLQERVLEALGANGLTPKQLYARMATDSPVAVDFAIRGLVRDNRMTLADGYYRRVGAPQVEHVVMEGETVVTATPITIVDSGNGGGGMAVVTVTAPEPATAAVVTPVPMRKCRRCQTSKPITDFPRRGPSTTARIMTCQACVEYEEGRALRLEAAKKAPSLPGVTELVQKPGKYTFSPDLVCRLIERQALAAKKLQEACDQVQYWRQELADVEAVVRVATARRGHESY
jgi:hypothetical protein